VCIASDASVTIADHVVAAIKVACEPLRHFPLAGPQREQFAPGLRVTLALSVPSTATGSPSLLGRFAEGAS
jgi:plasmid stabilization system protein ParE